MFDILVIRGGNEEPYLSFPFPGDQPFPINRLLSTCFSTSQHDQHRVREDREPDSPHPTPHHPTPHPRHKLQGIHRKLHLLPRLWERPNPTPGIPRL